MEDLNSRPTHPLTPTHKHANKDTTPTEGFHGLKTHSIALYYNYKDSLKFDLPIFFGKR